MKHMISAAVLAASLGLAGAALADTGQVQGIHVGQENGGCVAFDLVNHADDTSTRYATNFPLYQKAILDFNGETVGLNADGGKILCGTLLPTFTGLNNPPNTGQ